ncbi:MAG: type II toxin-antitoxin system PemK/MazF family toxin [Cyanobacteriota bacterium]|nr:type II toxin-antitoxin system PemK/MazF family toxin [Cyanobacteriota bacterium]
MAGDAPPKAPSSAGCPCAGAGLTKPSTALLDQVRSIDKQRIRRCYGEVSREELEAIDAGLCLFLGLEPVVEMADS